MVWDDLGRDAHDENRRDRDKLIGVYVGVLAVLLAIFTTGGGNATKDATIKNIEASDTWAFFQAKNLRRHTLRLEIEALELRLATEPGQTGEAKAAISSRIAEYKRQDESLTSDPERGEGLDQLFAKAKAIEAERNLAMKKDPYFDYAQALLQIAIVLASVALIAGGNFLLIVSLALAGLGTFMGLEGFTLFWPLPFMG